MYISARHIDVKLNQDYSDFISNDEINALILCDGIGEFHQSDIVAKTIVELFVEEQCLTVKELIVNNKILQLKESILHGGTTLISVVNKNNTNKIKIEYLGNGGIIHCSGDFAVTPNSSEPYRYAELMLPHISPNGALTKHISHNSQKQERDPSTLELNLNTLTGDILIFYTDGISSLEDKIILKDDDDRYWRSENPSIQFILKSLDSFLKNKDSLDFENTLVEFNESILRQLKENGFLEDDASLGLIVTKQVLEFYKSQKEND